MNPLEVSKPLEGSLIPSKKEKGPKASLQLLNLNTYYFKVMMTIPFLPSVPTLSIAILSLRTSTLEI